MGIFGDAFDWAKGAVGSAGDWVSGAWDTASGKSNYHANPYASDLAAAYTPLDQMAARQEAAGADYAHQVGAYAPLYAGWGQQFGDSLQAQGVGAQGAGARSAAEQRGVGQGMAATGDQYGRQFQAFGQQANLIGQDMGGQLGGIGSSMAQTGAQFGAGQSSLASNMLTGPSVAQLQGNAAAQRADQEIAARIAGARGTNTNLMMRDAIQSGQMQRANLASDLAAAAAQENVQRNMAASGMLGAAAQAAMEGQQGQLAAAQAAAQARLQGNAQAGQQYGQGFSAAMAGQQGQLGAMQGANQAEQAGNAANIQATQAAADARLRSLEGATQTTATAAGLGMQGQSQAANTLGAAAQTRTAQEQINAGSVDAANAANAGVQAGNAKNQSEFTGGILKAAGTAMMSDVRAKQDISLLSPEGNRQSLAALDGYEYRYKPDVAERIGEDTGPRVGIMAQDLEKAPAGEDVVLDTPEGKALDVNRALGFSLASLAGLNKRLEAIEQEKPVTSDERSKTQKRKLDPKDLGGVDASIVDAAARREFLPEAGGSHQAPDRVAEYDRIASEAKPLIKPRSAVGTAARSALSAAADTAALPATLAGRFAEASGYPNAAAHLSGSDLVADIDYLRAGLSPGESRRQRGADATAHPTASMLGTTAGSALGGLGLTGLARTAGLRGAGLAAAQGAIGAPAGTMARASLEGREASASDLAGDALKSAALSGLTAGAQNAAIASAAPKTPYYTVDTKAQEVARQVFGKPIDQKNAYKIVGTHPDIEDGSYYLTHDPLDNAMRLELSTQKGASVQVSFRVNQAGEKTATLDLFSLPPELQGRGIAKAVLKQQVQALDKAGIKTMDLTAVQAGKAVWPKLGFELKNPGEFKAIRERFDNWLRGAKIDPATVPARTLQEIANYRDGLVLGRDFLASKFSGGPLSLKADLSGPGAAALRAALGLKPKAASSSSLLGKASAQSSSSKDLSDMDPNSSTGRK